MTDKLRAPAAGIASGRLYELDSLRGLAALGIVVYHHGSHYHVFPLETLLAPLYREGWRAVDFFFVLSGFVLARAYWTARRSDRLASNVWDRVARLYPLHCVTLIVVACVQLILVTQLQQPPFVYQNNDGAYFLLNLLLVQGLDTSFNGPGWSISTEFVVNVLFFAVILLRRRAAILSMIMLILLTAPFFHPFWTGGGHLFGTIRGFFIGVLLQLFTVKVLSRTQRPVAGIANIVFMSTVVVLVVYSYLLSTIPQFSGGVMMLIFCVLVVSAPLSNVGSKFLCSAPLVFLGNISYSIYLVHFPLQLLLHLTSVSLGWSLPYQEIWFLLGFLALTIGCADLSYRWIELPGKRWMHSLTRAPRAALGSGRT